MKDYDFKFTAGPWKKNFFSVMARGSCDTYSGGVWGSIVYTEETSSTDMDGREFTTNGSRDHNARLIAKSPELAEFTRKVAMLNKDVGIGQGKLNSLIEEAQKLMDEVCGE